ncbi:MAG: redoxin family protein [Planctomycetota bacterium]
MRRTRMMAASVLMAVGAACGSATAQDALGGQTAQAVLKAETAAMQGGGVAMPDLTVGDRAPELKVASFIKGAPISEFEEGSVYLVDFWATWCGPCIASIPKLTEMQEKYADDNFTVLAVSVLERPEGDALIEHVSGFVEKRDDEMRYTIAVDDDGAMADSWLRASGQQGIPTAIIVGRDGNVAWVGYGTDPSLPGVVDDIVNDRWDMAEAREAPMQRAWYAHFMKVAGTDTDRATRLAAALFDEGKLTDPAALNGVAWRIVENEGWSEAAAGVARDMATDALRRMNKDDASTLDTLAWAYYRLGEYDNAIETQERAVANAGDGQLKAELAKSLEVFKARGG